MLYANARPLIRSGDMLAWTHRASMWKSWYDFKIGIVRMFSKSEYSHVGVAWVVGSRIFVLEAVTPKVRIFPLSKCGDFYWLPMNLEWKSDTEEVALSHIGSDYSQWQALLAYFSISKNDNLFYCDEYARVIYEEEGVQLAHYLMPTGLVRAVQESGCPLFMVTNE